MKSENLNELFKAMSDLQGELESAKKDTDNPFFKSKYADLESCWSVARPLMTKNGLSIIQLPETKDEMVVLKSILGHTSGQYIENELSMRPKDLSPQAIGSCITYARRYALSAMLGISAEDDDGNGAQGNAKKIIPQKPAEPTYYPEQYKKALAEFEKHGWSEKALLDEIIFNPEKVTKDNLTDMKNLLNSLTL